LLDHPDNLRLGETAFSHSSAPSRLGRLYIMVRDFAGGRSNDFNSITGARSIPFEKGPDPRPITEDFFEPSMSVVTVPEPVQLIVKVHGAALALLPPPMTPDGKAPMNSRR
ncbi:hypothetical protein, partial [Antarcticimicrobium sediminis]|uniref:hypothetical protein n=1 Tax=Antarcticimicrobium sediminis TaxID=2546227 RepID=UPI0019D2A25A